LHRKKQGDIISGGCLLPGTSEKQVLSNEKNNKPFSNQHQGGINAKTNVF